MIISGNENEWLSFFHQDFNYTWKYGLNTINLSLNELACGNKSYKDQISKPLEIELVEN